MQTNKTKIGSTDPFLVSCIQWMGWQWLHLIPVLIQNTLIRQTPPLLMQTTIWIHRTCWSTSHFLVYHIHYTVWIGGALTVLNPSPYADRSRGRGSAFEVPLKCKQPTANSHSHLPLLNFTLSTVGWSKTGVSSISRKNRPSFFGKFCHHRPILGISSLTRGFHDSRMWVFGDVTNIHTDRHCDSMTDPVKMARSVKIPHTGYQSSN